jgi:hypothetical protein
VNFLADQGAQALINELMPRQRPLARKLSRDNKSAEVSIVVAHDLHGGARQASLDQSSNFRRIHIDSHLHIILGARSVPAKYAASQRPIMIVYHQSALIYYDNLC